MDARPGGSDGRGAGLIRSAGAQCRSNHFDPAMSRSHVVTAVVTVLVVASAFALNPTPEQHRARIREAIAERSPLAAALGIGALAAFASTYHPLGVASYTTVNDRTVSIGAFGMVFVVQPSKE